MTNLHRLVAAAYLLAVLGCAIGSQTAYDDTMLPAADPVVVNVTNDYGLPVDVWASGSNIAHRLGTVAPGIVGHFVLRPGLLLAAGGVLELIAQPAGTERPVRSGRILLAQGDVVDFEITMHLLASYASVRAPRPH